MNSKKELEQYLDYINTIWEGIKSEVAIDNSLEETK